MNETILFSPFFKMLIPDFSNDTVNYQYKQLNGVYNFKNSKISNFLRHRKNIALHSTERQIPSINQPHFCTFSILNIKASQLARFLARRSFNTFAAVEIVKSIVRVYSEISPQLTGKRSWGVVKTVGVEGLPSPNPLLG